MEHLKKYGRMSKTFHATHSSVKKVTDEHNILSIHIHFQTILYWI